MNLLLRTSRLLRLESKHIASYLLNIVLAVICTLLILQNHGLKSAGGVDATLSFESGTRVEPFHYTNLDGTEAIFEYTEPEVKRLFFIFTTNCPHCQNSLTEVMKLVELATSLDNVQIVGISLDSREQTLQYYLDNKLRFPILLAGDDFIQRYSSFGVPIFILLKGDGVIFKTWRGELMSSRRSEILSLLTEPGVAVSESQK